ncbi:MAG: hypothetical protein ACRC46_13980 [Thermoguttaceae bacterium]
MLCRLSTVVLGFVLCLVVGCGDGNVGVTGKVMFPDGTPLTKGDVHFSTPTYVASGKIQSDGSYVIGSQTQNDGLPPGTYSVTVNKAFDDSGTAALSAIDSKPAKPLIDPKYNSPTTSGLTCDVKGKTTFDITVEPFKK